MSHSLPSRGRRRRLTFGDIAGGPQVPLIVETLVQPLDSTKLHHCAAIQLFDWWFPAISKLPDLKR